jgi:pSer/pThr/pTyr-binding forkhead associated (FHA) protein
MASLVVIDGPTPGGHFPLGSQKLVSVGRDDQCTFQVVDDEISRKHLQLRLEKDGRHYAADYRSANGVYVNDRRITTDVPLADDDRIRIGRTTIIYTSRDFDDAESAVAAMKKSSEWRRSTIIRHD